MGTVVTAGTIINDVRDEVPDPVFDPAGVPLPDNDGMVRARTLYRWLDVGVRRAARNLGAVVEDWTAIAQVAFQPWYNVDPLFTKIDSGFSSQFPLETLLETDTIWPQTSLTVSQSLTGFYRRRAERLAFGLWPAPNVSDPSTTLVNALAAGGVDPIPLVSTAGFLPYGYVLIDSEIIQYQQLSTAPVGIQTISRGVCGTTAIAHNQAAPVQHLALWLKGERAPNQIVSSTSVVELPYDVIDILETYLLARYRRQEQEFAEGTSLMKEFDQECARLKADPARHPENRWQVPEPGEPRVGPLYGRGWGWVVR